MKFKLFGKVFDTEEIKKKKKEKKKKEEQENAAWKVVKETVSGAMSSGGPSLVGFFIGIMVVIIISVSVVIPVIQESTKQVNITMPGSPVVTIMNLVPLFIVLAIVVMVVGLMRF